MHALVTLDSASGALRRYERDVRLVNVGNIYAVVRRSRLTHEFAVQPPHGPTDEGGSPPVRAA